jgi:hypothetical protein
MVVANGGEDVGEGRTEGESHLVLKTLGGEERRKEVGGRNGEKETIVSIRICVDVFLSPFGSRRAGGRTN